MDKPRVLICTVESWNSKIGANTFSELFRYYDCNKLANLYIREEIPDSKICSRYFQISEIRTLKSITNRKIKSGKEIFPTEYSDNLLEIEENNKLYKGKKRSYAKLFAREIAWKIGKWKTEELDLFLESFNPNVVIFSMEGYIHFNSVCKYILKKTKAKGIGYFWDDNFTYKQDRNSIGYYVFRFFQRKSLKRLAKITKSFFAITEKTKHEADSFFHINCKILTKPIDSFQDVSELEPHFPLKILYTGNLKIGRLDVLKKIANILDAINKNNPKLQMDVYSSTYLSDNDINELGSSVRFWGCVPQEKVVELQRNADILLFLESFTKGYAKIARLSFSTKITDYLSTGKCIFAVGPRDIAPMEYLNEQDAALCVFDEEHIFEALNRLVETPKLIEDYSKKAMSCGMRNHRREVIQKILYKELGLNEDSTN